MATAASTRAFTASSRSLIDYWHLLSLDAPTVAALWASALCLATDGALPVPSIVSLAVGTWLFYAADRILDGSRGADLRQLRQRHHFHREHRKTFGIFGVVACITLVALTIDLPGRVLLGFSVVLIAALAYFVVVHWHGAASKRWLPKEFAVGVIFAAAVAVPAWSQLQANMANLSFLYALILLAALFWLNCFAIESWESRPDETWPPARAPAPALSRGLHAQGTRLQCVRFMSAAVALAAVVFLATDSRLGSISTLSPVYLSVLCSAAILFHLNGSHGRFSPLRLRIAADAALLTPMLFVMLPRMLLSPIASTFLRAR